MSILELAKNIDNLLIQDEFVLTIQKAGGVASILVHPLNNDQIEFCKVGGIYAVKINDEELQLTSNEFENLLSPYLGKRMFLQLMN